MAVTEKQDEENQAFDVCVPELSCPSLVCPSLATFRKSLHFAGSKIGCERFSFLFVKLVTAFLSPFCFPLGRWKEFSHCSWFPLLYLRNKQRQILLIPSSLQFPNSFGWGLNQFSKFCCLLCLPFLCHQCCWFQRSVIIMKVLSSFLVDFWCFLKGKHSTCEVNLCMLYVPYVKQFNNLPLKNIIFRNKNLKNLSSSLFWSRWSKRESTNCWDSTCLLERFFW